MEILNYEHDWGMKGAAQSGYDLLGRRRKLRAPIDEVTGNRRRRGGRQFQCSARIERSQIGSRSLMVRSISNRRRDLARLSIRTAEIVIDFRGASEYSLNRQQT